jgi:outer membrane protein assembly factor BamD
VSLRFGKTFLMIARLSLVPVLASCASGDDDKSITYSMTAKQNYEKGLAELKDENYTEASRFFSFVRQKFPFSKYAVLAELALADTQYDRGEYQQAIDAYKNFIRLHPTHEKVEDGYVAFRICECCVREMPEDFFLLPPAYEKDQSAVRDALRELDDFLDKYPESKYLDQGKKFRRDVLQRLIEHEVYVARFYLDREQPKAAILRLEGALKRYPESGREAELLLALGETHLQMGNALTAKKSFERIIGQYGATHQARRAELFLGFIRRRFGDAPRDAPPPGEGGEPAHG